MVLPSETPSDKGLYLTVYPLSCPNTDNINNELSFYCICETSSNVNSVTILTSIVIKRNPWPEQYNWALSKGVYKKE